MFRTNTQLKQETLLYTVKIMRFLVRLVATFIQLSDQNDDMISQQRSIQMLHDAPLFSLHSMGTRRRILQTQAQTILSERV